MIQLGNQLDINDLRILSNKGEQVFIDEAARLRINNGHAYLKERIQSDDSPVYGINTGFGSLYNQKIDAADLSLLQENLLMSHACGIGDIMPDEVVRLMLVLKIQSLSFGYSGVSLVLVEKLIEMYNRDILPVVYSMGSLGASGDLAPLAHLCLPLIGKGLVKVNGEMIASSDAGLLPIQLGPKEGLALINGTQFMSAVLASCILKARKIRDWADVISSISLEAFDGRLEPFHYRLHEIRPHKGQIQVSKRISNLLKGSDIITQAKQHVQDPYSFRCIPQVHGASTDVLAHVETVLVTEINSVTDNPNIFPDEDLIISGGNFHGQTLAMHADFLSIALSEWGNISERRIFQLISGQRGLPPFLVKKAGLNSGFMIPQYTAASIVNRNKVLCTPASIDSIVSSNGQEDHVSMGATAAYKCLEIATNTLRILGIEFMNASQAIWFREPMHTSEVLSKLLDAFRMKVPLVEKDVVMHDLMRDSFDFLNDNDAPLL